VATKSPEEIDSSSKGLESPAKKARSSTRGAWSNNKNNAANIKAREQEGEGANQNVTLAKVATVRKKTTVIECEGEVHVSMLNSTATMNKGSELNTRWTTTV